MTQNHRFKKVYISDNTYQVRLSFGKITFCVRTYVLAGKDEQLSISQAMHRPKQRETKVTFFPIFTRILNPLEWMITKSNGCWKQLLHTFNLRPWDSPIFEFAGQGNTKEVEKLLLNGLASVNDMTEYGNTVLDVRPLSLCTVT